jgi:HEAT repeat protein
MKENRTHRTLRWLLSVAIVALGLTATWAWGQVARLAEPGEGVAEPLVTVAYAAWQVEQGQPEVLHRSLDGGASWQPLELPGGLAARTWADDGRDSVAVAGQDGSLLISRDRGESWQQLALDAPAFSLAWDASGHLYAGTREQGIYRLGTDGNAVSLTPAGSPLTQAPIVALDEANGRLFAATPTIVYYTDGAAVDGAAEWLETTSVEGWITSLAALDPEVVYAGTATLGVMLTTDAGQVWAPAREGLGLAAGQMVHITALRIDPQEPGVLYATVNHTLGATEVHSSAAGAFVSVDGGAMWQPLDGPSFPEARPASALVTLPGQPLAVQAVTDEGLQAYEPDVAGALAALDSDDAATRAQAVRLLGLARASEAGDELLAALSDSDPAVSLMAGEALARLNDPGTSSGLLVALEHPNEQVRLVAAQALGQMGVDAAVKPLRAMLFQGSGAEATIAGQALGRIGSPAAIEALIAALEEPVPTSRWHAAMTGLEAAGTAAVGPLQELLDSRDVYVRRNAAEALGWIGAPDATPGLVRALRDRDETVRSRAAWSLGIIGDPAAQRALQNVSTGDPSLGVREQASRALTLLEAGPAQASRSWYVDWAPLLNRLEPVRWLLLALSLAAAAWLMVGVRPQAPVFLQQRAREQ